MINTRPYPSGYAHGNSNRNVGGRGLTCGPPMINTWKWPFLHFECDMPDVEGSHKIVGLGLLAFHFKTMFDPSFFTCAISSLSKVIFLHEIILDEWEKIHGLQGFEPRTLRLTSWALYHLMIERHFPWIDPWSLGVKYWLFHYSPELMGRTS